MWEVGEINRYGELIHPVIDIGDGTARVFVYQQTNKGRVTVHIVDCEGEGPELDLEDFYKLYASLTAIKAGREGRTVG